MRATNIGLVGHDVVVGSPSGRLDPRAADGPIRYVPSRSRRARRRENSAVWRERLREFTSPAVVTIADDATLTDVVVTHANTRPDAVMFRRRPEAVEPGTATSTAWTPVSAAEFFLQVKSLAAGFLAAGFVPGQRVGLLSRTRYEWTLTDYALWHAGLVTVPIYETSAPDQICWILGDSQAVGVVVETDTHASTVAEIRDQIPDLRKIWVIENRDLDGLAREGEAADPAVLAAARDWVNAASLASIIYTSGTTGRPKGCALTHRNLLFGATSAVGSLPALFTSDTSALLFLPLAHVFARDIQVALVHAAVPCRPLPEHAFVAGRPRRVQANAAARRPLCFRKALCRRATEGGRREQGQDLRACVRDGDPRQRGDGARPGCH